MNFFSPTYERYSFLSLYFTIFRLIRAVGHKLKRIGALNHPLRAEKDEDVVMGAHALTGVEELLDACFTVMENYTGKDHRLVILQQ